MNETHRYLWRSVVSYTVAQYSFKTFYHIKSTIIKATDTITDLGIKRSCNGFCSEYCYNILKVTRTCGMIWHIFPSGHSNLLWPALQIYVLSIFTHCSPLWSPFLKRDIDAVETVQPAFTKPYMT